MKVVIPLFCCLMLYCIMGCTPCSTKIITCSAFEDSVFFNWFPYHPGSTGYFKNSSTQDTLGFIATQSDTSKSYETTVGGLNRPNAGSCDAYALIAGKFNQNANGNFTIYYNVFKGVNDGGARRSLEIYFRNYNWVGGAITGNTILADTLNNRTAVTQTENVLFDNGITYSRLVTLTNDTVFKKENDMLYKLFIAKGHGIVGFETYPLKQKWVIQ
jgi:hypothetical protein